MLVAFIYVSTIHTCPQHSCVLATRALAARPRREAHRALLRQPPLRTRGAVLHRPEVRAAGAVHADGEAGADLQDGVRGGRRGRLPHQIRHRAGQADQD